MPPDSNQPRRREFLQTLALAGAAAALPASISTALAAEAPTFRLNYAPHEGMFENAAGKDIVAQIHHAADLGFRGWEDNNLKQRTPAEQERMAKALAERGMRMGVFVAAEIGWSEPNLASGDAALREKFLSEIRASVEVAKRIGATWMTVVPGHVDARQHMEFQSAHVLESLRQAAAILEPHGLVIVIEPLNFRDHPGMFLSNAPQAYHLCKAVASPACKVLFDIYHEQISIGNLLPNIEQAWDEIAYFQIGDNPGRKEPTTGEINYREIFRRLHARGYNGILGMEHGKSQEGVAGEEALVRAYRYSDDF